ncbi:MAG: TIGR00282 family metallophosphoesterase [Phycisphaerales bacterium]
MRIAFLGDINGSPGRQVVSQQIPILRERWRPDLIIANAENARAGSGLTPDLYRQFRGLGIDACTLGDHAFRDSKIVPLLDDPAEPVARPANLSRKAPGKRSIRLHASDRLAADVWVITVLGRIFMPLPADDPFAAVDAFLESLPVAPPRRGIVLVEAHMEATSEKAALGRYLDGRVTAVLGSHTHVPTADAKILRGGTGFITDVGMCGPYDSVIGRDTDQVLRAMTTSVHVPYEMGQGGEALCGVVIDVDESSGRCVAIERVELAGDRSRAPFRAV